MQVLTGEITKDEYREKLELLRESQEIKKLN
jgi:hypothetical protein